MTAIRQNKGKPPSGFDLLEAARKVCKHWEMRLQPDDPRNWQVGEARRLVEAQILAADHSPKALGSVHRLLCAGCGSVHPGLALLCSGRSVARLRDCWLLKGYTCPVVPAPVKQDLA
jgi:hypothetical protein